MKLDLLDFETTAAVFGSTKFDAVVHLAALSLVGESMLKPMQYLSDNIGMGSELVKVHAQPRREPYRGLIDR